MAPVYTPQLARLVKSPPDGDDWLHEMKYDGYRIGADVRQQRATLLSRNGKDWTAAFPEVADAVRSLGVRDALLDGEVAIVLPDGRTSFQALQNAGPGPRRGLTYFVFDLLRLDGRNLRRLPLIDRKRELQRVLGGRHPKTLRFSEHVVGRGKDVFAEACRLQLEGIISKQRDAPHTAGRTDAWVKTKCVLRQEFVIGGFTDPEGSRQGIGALLVGFYDDTGTLRFAGKVGTGFSIEVAQQLRTRLGAIERRESPFVPRPAGTARAHWAEPKLVGEVAFTEWTSDGKIRHPSFQGLRNDKPAKRVTRERPADAPLRVPRRLGRPGPPASAPARTGGRGREDGASIVAGVRITHPDRKLYQDVGITKLDLAVYFERIAPWMLPHVESRALTLVRCPDGAGASCFYMKHSKVWAPAGVRRVNIQEKTKVGEYLVADNVTALVGLAQMSVLEIHTWNSRVEKVEHPDRLVLDIDPGERIVWKQVIEAAKMIRSLLEEAGLESFPKTTGGRGLHVVVPLTPSAGWEQCLEFARSLAIEMERRDPRHYTTAFAKAGRSNKMLIDYLRNNRTNTSVAAFSPRARPGAPVSTPLRWTDLKTSLDPASLTMATIEGWLRRRRVDPWKDYWRTRQRLPRTMPWSTRR